MGRGGRGRLRGCEMRCEVGEGEGGEELVRLCLRYCSCNVERGGH